MAVAIRRTLQPKAGAQRAYGLRHTGLRAPCGSILPFRRAASRQLLARGNQVRVNIVDPRRCLVLIK